MEILKRHFDIALETPDGIAKLRELILALAMQGKLIPQNSNNKSASQLLKEIEIEKKTKSENRADGKPRKLISPLPIKEDEVPYKLPIGWVWCRLDSISEYIQRGKGPTYSEIQEIPVISQKCIQWSGFDKDIVKYIDPTTINSYQDERFILTGDLLWNSTGTGTIGRINMYDGQLDSYSKVVADSHVTVIRPIKVDNRYVLNFLMSPYVQRDLEENASGTTNQIELNTSMVKNQLVPLPPFEEQTKIVEKIRELMMLCDELEKQRDQASKLRIEINRAATNRLLAASENHAFNSSWKFITDQFDSLYCISENVGELKKSILQLAIFGKLAPQDEKGQTARQLLLDVDSKRRELIGLTKVKKHRALPPIKLEEIPFELPKEWAWCRLGEICSKIGSGSTPRGGKEVYRREGIKFIRSQNVYDEGLVFENIAFIDNATHERMSNTAVYANDILLNITGGSIGRCALVPENFDEANVNQHVTIIRLLPGILNQYIHYLILSKYFQDKIMAVQTGGNREGLAKKNMQLMLIPLPPSSEQKRIVSRIGSLHKLCDSLNKQIKESTDKKADILNAILARV
jgi:type I restriction enzyme S subunit